VRGIDTNVLIRHLVQDDREQANRATEFITEFCSRENPAFINRIVLCETVWVLDSAYGYSREEISGVLERVLQTQQFAIEDIHAAWVALRLYRDGAADFADCLLADTNLQAGCEETVTLDRKASRAAGMRLLSSAA
jgi:predicted nucleic-acid-binding protein